MNPTGQITTFLKALGATNPDPAILEVVTLVGPKLKKQAGIDGGEFWTFTKTGCDLSFSAEGRLETIFLRPFDTTEYGVDYDAYPDMSKFVDGMEAQPNRSEIRRVFGEPDQEKTEAWLHRVGENWVNFQFDDEDDVILITLMDELPL